MRTKEISTQLKIAEPNCRYSDSYFALKKKGRNRKIYRYYVSGKCLIKKNISFKAGHYKYPIWINYSKGEEFYIVFDSIDMKFLLGKKGSMWGRNYFVYIILTFNFNKLIPFEAYCYNKIEKEHGILNNK